MSIVHHIPTDTYYTTSGALPGSSPRIFHGANILLRKGGFSTSHGPAQGKDSAFISDCKFLAGILSSPDGRITGARAGDLTLLTNPVRVVAERAETLERVSLHSPPDEPNGRMVTIAELAAMLARFASAAG